MHVQPLSLEELLKKKQQKEQIDAKVCRFGVSGVLVSTQLAVNCVQPKFLSKQEREALALQRRDEAVAAQRLKCVLCPFLQ